ncbi:MAG TPA: helix-turn-helix transcriptional regulator [Methylomirabilota bacterium]|nr:helix-turn-helix transcriptional regulator [Methylomirabilota bacterium]
MTDKGKPLYMIGVVAQMLNLHPQTLRMYEKKGLIRPSRTEGRTRLYSPEDLEEIARVVRLARDLGVNLAGIEIILKMRRRMLAMQGQLEEMMNYVRADMTEGGNGDPTGRSRSEALVRAASSQLKPLDLF